MVPRPAGAGTYTYTVAATAPCATDATATITVTEQQQPDAGSDDNLAICEGDSVTAAQLFAALGGTPDAGGTWSPAPAGAGTYTYTVAATAPCATDATATITVTEQQQPDAGSDDNLAICEGDSVTAAQLFAALGGTPDAGGTWSPAPAGAGTYTYTVAATAPCATDATATITVTEQQQPDAGSDDNLAICEGDSVTAAQLFAALGGTPDAGGTWSPAPAGAGTYTYTVAATAPCATDATATITVTEQQQPDAGSDDNLAICEGDSVTAAQLFAALGGTPDAGGTWSPAPAGAGTYTYTVAATAPCATDATATITVTEQQQPDAGSDDNLAICEGDSVTAAQLFAALGGTPDAGGTWSPAPAGAGTYTYTVAATAPCATDATATITVTEQQQPDADNLSNVEACDSYVLPELTNGNYFTGSGGTGTPLSAGDVISTSQTIYIFSPGNGICPYVENSFSVNITGFSVSTHVQHETCWENDNGSVSIEIGDAVFPVTVQLNSMEPMVFNTDSFSITDLSPGNYEMSVIDDTGCETNTNFTILQGGPNLSGSVNVMYLCDANLPSNTIDVTLSDSSISSNVLYALDSTDPNDFILSPDFGNINPGKHSLFILHDNGCVGEITFEVENFEPLELSLTSEYVNQITANVTGGTAPYTYYFDDNDATDSNTYTITRSGAFTVRVIDSNGCEVVQSISMNLMEITIPDFFTPNFDGQNDYWAPRNTKLFPDIETYIFDRYGRKIWTLGPSEAWDGEYDSKPMPSGDYWYIVKLNDGSGREFVGHFTLYR
ncbi:T9SS type B sorting domain-containing protein [Flagellimonas marinaquae]|uniref:T9SS type B sorting domain-containing protein n=1 Tax=Flagellimonas marinaquae TaxID=254955 RepID=UPI0020766193|nr:T9SS type B sorting domain-containing protein [Allomuricauda aquimarina]USD23802.1 T9SS type B sorting domain-containing protein [Allomuricauda aquimarina]